MFALVNFIFVSACIRLALKEYGSFFTVIFVEVSAHQRKASGDGVQVWGGRDGERKPTDPPCISFAVARATRWLVFFRTPDVIFAKIFRAAEASTPVCVLTPAQWWAGHGKRARRRGGKDGKKKKIPKAIKPCRRRSVSLAASGIKLQSHLEEKHERSDTTLRCNITLATPDDGGEWKAEGKRSRAP